MKDEDKDLPSAADVCGILKRPDLAAAPPEGGRLDPEELRINCHATFNGGWHDNPDAMRAFHHGMDTVCNVLRECGPLVKESALHAVLLPFLRHSGSCQAWPNAFWKNTDDQPSTWGLCNCGLREALAGPPAGGTP